MRLVLDKGYTVLEFLIQSNQYSYRTHDITGQKGREVSLKEALQRETQQKCTNLK